MYQNKKCAKQRLDEALVTRGLVASREQAGRLILAGQVRVNGTLIDKRARLVDAEAGIGIVGQPMPYVSRGGGKLEAALEAFEVECCGLVAMDVGASTGGFTDCLLQRGASRVYAVDVGYGQLDWRIRRDPRVVLLERCNIRHLKVSSIADPIDLVVIDVSFISLKLVIPSVVKFLSENAILLALVKPQFEVGIGQVGRGGIVRDDAKRVEVTEKTLRYAEMLGLHRLGVLDSPITGKKGNREVLIGLRRSRSDHELSDRSA